MIPTRGLGAPSLVTVYGLGSRLLQIIVSRRRRYRGMIINLNRMMRP